MERPIFPLYRKLENHEVVREILLKLKVRIPPADTIKKLLDEIGKEKLTQEIFEGIKKGSKEYLERLSVLPKFLQRRIWFIVCQYLKVCLTEEFFVYFMENYRKDLLGLYQEEERFRELIKDLVKMLRGWLITC